MLITDIQKHFIKPIYGAIHIGAHHGEEKNWYITNNINKLIWVEANPEYEQILKQKFPEDVVLIYGIGSEDRDEQVLQIANNGQSSSFLNLGTHATEHPSIHYIKEIKVPVRRIDTLIEENNIDIATYNFVNIDVQGYELEVLKGFGKYLDNVDYIYCEVNVEHLYENCALMDDIDDFLQKYKFHRVETLITPNKWGDALYIKL